MNKLGFSSHVIVVVLVSVWVNASEVFRYFAIVMPETRELLHMVPNIAPMNLTVFLIWGLWDTLLTTMIVVMYWLVAQHRGHSFSSAGIAGLASWAFFFVLFWVGMINMSLTSVQLALVALPLALVETVVASGIACLLYRAIDRRRQVN